MSKHVEKSAENCIIISTNISSKVAYLLQNLKQNNDTQIKMNL